MLIKYSFAWFGMMIIAIINGIVRDFGYATLVSEQAAHQISTITLILFFASWYRFLTLKWPIESSKQAWKIDTIWLILTLTVETVIGLTLTGLSPTEIIQHYNIFSGNLWMLIPLWTLTGPRIFYMIQKK